MNVGQLIRKLQKLDKSLPVYFAAHDNSSHEVQGRVGQIRVLSKDDDDISDSFFVSEMPDNWVTLRP